MIDGNGDGLRSALGGDDDELVLRLLYFEREAAQYFLDRRLFVAGVLS